MGCARAPEPNFFKNRAQAPISDIWGDSIASAMEMKFGIHYDLDSITNCANFQGIFFLRGPKSSFPIFIACCSYIIGSSATAPTSDWTHLLYSQGCIKLVFTWNSGGSKLRFRNRHNIDIFMYIFVQECIIRKSAVYTYVD